MKKRLLSFCLALVFAAGVLTGALPAVRAASASDSGWEFSGDVGVRYAVNGVETTLMVTGQKYSVQFWLQNIGPYSVSVPLAWDPSVARIIGVEWLARLLYPEAYPVDLNERIRQYYSLFYHRDLTDEEITALLEYAG